MPSGKTQKLFVIKEALPEAKRKSGGFAMEYSNHTIAHVQTHVQRHTYSGSACSHKHTNTHAVQAKCKTGSVTQRSPTVNHSSLMLGVTFCHRHALLILCCLHTDLLK